MDRRLVPTRDPGNLSGQREDHVEICHGQQVLDARLHPVARGCTLALRAVPVFAGVTGDVLMAAFGACRDMAAERLGSAGLDRRHPLEPGETDMTRIGPPPRGAISWENIRTLQRAFGHADQPVRSDPAHVQTG